MSFLGLEGLHMLGKTKGEKCGPSCLRQRKSSVLHLVVSRMSLMPDLVFDSRTRTESPSKLTASHLSASASRWDHIPVSSIRTINARRNGGATAKILSSSSKVMNTNLPRYCAYQPTESEWLNELPLGWKAIQLARLNSKLTNGFVGPTRDILCESGDR